MTASRTVLIINAEYTNLYTGTQASSQVYHLPGLGCIDRSEHKVEVEERLAVAFGRRLCATCTNRVKATEYLDATHKALVDAGWPDLDTLAHLVPDGLEVRLYDTRGRGQARRVWSSTDARSNP